MTRGSGPFRLNLAWHGDEALVAVHGFLDFRAITELSERLSEIVKVAQPRKLIVDLGNAAYESQAAGLADARNQLPPSAACSG
jgi:anti-anti-sigma regulatory factor